MPGSLVSSLLSFIASHLVVLTLSGFLLVGGYLAGFWGPGSDSLVESKKTPADNGPVSATAEGISPSATGPADAKPDAPPHAAPEPSRQPTLIGGSLPNYGRAGDTPFRPPRAATESSRPPWSDREALVQQARRAFWNGDFEGAETAYVTLISQYPDDADAFGELGNLYQSMGKPAEALDAYYAAAVRLRALGEREKLSEVIDLLDTYNYPDTEQLRP